MAARKRAPRRVQKHVTPKECYFCVDKKEPVYSQVEVLRRFVTERGKIIGRDRSGVCVKHQKRLTLAIKHARHLALLPFLARI